MRNKNSKFDNRKLKSIIVGIIVFIVVFTGLTLYQQTSENAIGDIIMTVDEDISGESEAESGENSLVLEDKGNEGVESSSDTCEKQTIFVDVCGAVHISGLFALPAGSRVADAIDAAGGLTEDAEVKYINRAFVLSDGDRLYIPTFSEVLDGTAPPSAGQVSLTGGMASGSSSGAFLGNPGTGLININTANSNELQKLNGVGPVTAQKIIDYRTNHGMFKRIEDLMNVSGIGSKTFEKLREYITV